MVKLYFDDWMWRCENCKKGLCLPGIVPSLEMLIDREWKYCPHCGKRIDWQKTMKKDSVKEILNEIG